MDGNAGSNIPQAASTPLLGGNPGTPGLRDSFDPKAGPKNPWPTIIGMITTISVIVIVLVMLL